jgi:hypothetical protein
MELQDLTPKPRGNPGEGQQDLNPKPDPLMSIGLRIWYWIFQTQNALVLLGTSLATLPPSVFLSAPKLGLIGSPRVQLLERFY